jgi:protein TonB
MVKKHITLLALLLSVLFLYAQINENVAETILVVEYAPVFKGDMREFIQSKIVYPESAKKDLMEGIVFVSFWIDTVGLTFNHEVIRGIREDLDNEALRVAKLIKFEKPALQKGKSIAVEFTVPIKFSLKNADSIISFKEDPFNDFYIKEYPCCDWRVQDATQNFIHRWIGRQNYYTRYDYFNAGMYRYSGYYNPFSLY